MMDEPCSSNALPPFLAKTYEMVDDPSTNSVVSWSHNDRSFVVWNSPAFARDLLPKYFKHNNFSSFIRQLNTYGFRKVDPEQWEFSNEDFVRGQPHLLKNIHRRKPVHSHSGHGTSQSPLTEIERQGYKDDIERLKTAKESLHLELNRFKQEHEELELQLRSMTERVQHVEKHQKSMISSLARTLQKPMATLDLMVQSDKHDRKRRLPPGNNCVSNKVSAEDNQIDSSRMLSKEDLNVTSLLAFNRDILEQLETSLSFWENILFDIQRTCERPNSSPGLDESTSCAESPTASYTQFNVQAGDVRSKTSGIDMNCEPNNAIVTENATAKEQVAVNTRNAPTGVNDVFWEQFLTENPGSADASEVQSERKDADYRKDESKQVDHGKFWWNSRSLNSRAEQLGHLAPVERT